MDTNSQINQVDLQKTIEDIDEKIKAYKLKIYKLKQKRDEYYKLLKELENNSEIGYEKNERY